MGKNGKKFQGRLGTLNRIFTPENGEYICLVYVYVWFLSYEIINWLLHIFDKNKSPMEENMSVTITGFVAFY